MLSWRLGFGFLTGFGFLPLVGFLTITLALATRMLLITLTINHKTRHFNVWRWLSIVHNCKPAGQRPVGRQKQRWMDNIERIWKELVCHCMALAQDETELDSRSWLETERGGRASLLHPWPDGPLGWLPDLTWLRHTLLLLPYDCCTALYHSATDKTTAQLTD